MDPEGPVTPPTSLFVYACTTPTAPASAQLEAARAHAAGLGLQPAGEYRDDAGAWGLPLRDRPAGRRLLAALSPGAGVVVATPLALVAMPLAPAPAPAGFPALAAALREIGVTLHVAGLVAEEVPTLAAALTAAQALGAKSRSEQIRAGMAKARAAGRRLTRHPPIGHRWVWRGGQFFADPDPEELAVVS